MPLCGEPAGQPRAPARPPARSARRTSAPARATRTRSAAPSILTGPYNGAPYGLSIPVEAAAGPFDLGKLVTRVSIGVDPHSARVIAASTLPTIFKGVPLRLRNISVLVNRPNFLFNPTNCGAALARTAR